MLFRESTKMMGNDCIRGGEVSLKYKQSDYKGKGRAGVV